MHWHNAKNSQITVVFLNLISRIGKDAPGFNPLTSLFITNLDVSRHRPIRTLSVSRHKQTAWVGLYCLDCMYWLTFFLSVFFLYFSVSFCIYLFLCVYVCVLVYKFNNNNNYNNNNVFNVALHLSVITCTSLFPHHS